MTSYRIIPMTESVLSEVEAIDKELFKEDHWTKNSLMSSIKEHHAYIVTSDSAEPSVTVGYIIFSSVLDEGELLHIGVARNFQRQGLAKKMLNFMEEYGKLHGVTKWFLEVRQSNNAAASLYLHTGFRPVGIRKNYYKTNSGREDAVVMLKEKEC